MSVRFITRPVRAFLACLVIFLLLPSSSGLAVETPEAESRNTLFLGGQLLVASPKMGDPRFAKTVIYMVHHDQTGALGLIVNKAFGSGPMDKFLKGFDIHADDINGEIRIHYGGPVAPNSAFVLHTADYNGPGTRVVDRRMAMTTEMSVLKAIAEGNGPRRSLFALGYSGWGAGQLEGEIARGDWFSAPADEELIFDEDLDTKWKQASGKAGLKL